MRNFIKTSIVIFALLLGVQTLNAETKRALLVGISDYGNATEEPNMWKNIHGANDIPLLTPLLKGQGFSVKSLVDAKATYAGITKVLEKLIADSRKGDVVYLHFSMHGQPFEDLNGDEADGWDEALIPVDAQMVYKKGVYEGKNHLLDDELGEYVNKLRTKLGPTGKVYVILDACHSGSSSRGDDDNVRGIKEGFTRSGKLYKPDRTRETNDYFKVSTQNGQSPVVYVEACRSYELNNEIWDKETNTCYGSLSYYIAQALRNKKVVGSKEWIDAIKTGMKESHSRKVRKQNVVIEKSE